MTNTDNKTLAIIDTNVFINALFGNGMFRNDMKILDLEEQGIIRFAFSDSTRNELLLITARKITEHELYDSVEFFDLLYEIFDRSITINEANRLEQLSTDKSDQMFIEAAVEVNANYLITNDTRNGLLELERYKNVLIWKPDKFIRRMNRRRVR